VYEKRYQLGGCWDKVTGKPAPLTRTGKTVYDFVPKAILEFDQGNEKKKRTASNKGEDGHHNLQMGKQASLTGEENTIGNAMEKGKRVRRPNCWVAIPQIGALRASAGNTRMKAQSGKKGVKERERPKQQQRTGSPRGLAVSKRK